MRKRQLLLPFVIGLIIVSFYAWNVPKVQALPGDLVWMKSYNPTTSSEFPRGVAVDSTGVYIAGEEPVLGSSGDVRWRIEKRSLTTGNVMWSRSYNPSSHGDAANDITVDKSGVYIVGYDYLPGNAQWRIQKRDRTTGNLVWSKSYNPSSKGEVAKGVAVDRTGVYIVGFDCSLGDAQWRMEKRNSTTGKIIWSRSYNPSSYDDIANDVTVDKTGIYIVGYDYSLGLGNAQWRVQKRNLTNGNVIWSKGYNPSSHADEASCIAVDTTGLYIVGYDSYPGSENLQWRMQKRSLTTGNIVWSRNYNPSVFEDVATGVAVDSTGVYVVGYDYSPSEYDSQWRIQKRSLTTGSIIWSKSYNPDITFGGFDGATGVAVDSTGVYIVGYGLDKWVVQKRNR